MRRFLLLFFLVTIGLSVLFLKWIDVAFSRKTFAENLGATPQYWSHRGLGENLQANTIPAFEAARNKGAEGIEIDIFYDEQLHALVVSHDYPYTKYNDTIQRLTDFISRFKDSTYYWLDFKNLTLSNAGKVAGMLNPLLDSFGIRSKVFVESAEAMALGNLARKNIHSLYWVQYNRSNFILKWLKLHYLKFRLLSAPYSGITTAYEFYDDDFRENFRQVPTFVFHPTDTMAINKLTGYDGLEVVLTDGWFIKRHMP